MDKYHYKFTILQTSASKQANQALATYGWYLEDHKGTLVAFGNGYKNWHNAKRAMDRHIAVIQSGNFSLPPKPLRKEYTFKSKKEKSK